jgi:hypothetical protein
MSQYPEEELDVDALQVGLDAAVEHLRRFKRTQADLAQARIERDNLQARIEELHQRLEHTEALLKVQSELSESRRVVIDQNAELQRLRVQGSVISGLV